MEVGLMSRALRISRTRTNGSGWVWTCSMTQGCLGVLKIASDLRVQWSLGRFVFGWIRVLVVRSFCCRKLGGGGWKLGGMWLMMMMVMVMVMVMVLLLLLMMIIIIIIIIIMYLCSCQAFYQFQRSGSPSTSQSPSASGQQLASNSEVELYTPENQHCQWTKTHIFFYRRYTLQTVVLSNC